MEFGRRSQKCADVTRAFQKRIHFDTELQVFAVFVNLKIILSQLYPEICSWKFLPIKANEMFRGKKGRKCFGIFDRNSLKIFDVTLKMRDKCKEITIYISDKFWNRANPVSNFILSLCLLQRERERHFFFLFHSHIHFTFHIKNSKWHFSRNLILVFKHFN